ncbi:MAG: DUF1949 domain-containing protein [Ignavibacteriaceae bacterium]
MNQVNNIYHLADEFNGKITKSDYSDKVKFECLVSSEKVEPFKTMVNELSKGEAKIFIEERLIFI